MEAQILWDIGTGILGADAAIIIGRIAQLKVMG